MEIKVGTKGKQTKIVEKKDTATAYGSGLAEVFATPAMIGLMEKTAYTSIESQLEEGQSSVGIEINVKHLRASLPGAIINCKSEVINSDKNKVYFRITATDEKGEIGTAEHIRYIIDEKRFMDKLKQ